MTLTAAGGSQIGTTTTDNSGFYSFSAVAAGESYTVTPSLSGDSFTPASQSFSALSANVTQNFTGSPTDVTTWYGQFTFLSSGGLFPAGLSSLLSGSSTTESGGATSVTVNIAPLGYNVAACPSAAASSSSPTLQKSGTFTANFFTNADGINLMGTMPQVVSGGNQWTTTFTLLNTGTGEAQVSLNFFDGNGNPLQLPLTFPQGAPNQTTASYSNSMAAGAGLVIQTAGLSNPLSVGWAELLSNGQVSGFAVFTDTVSSTQQQQAVAPLASQNLPAYLLWYDNTNGFSTGVALANASAQPANVAVVLRDSNGVLLSTQTISMPAMGHISLSLAQPSTWPANTTFAATQNARGTLEIDTPANGLVSVLALAFNPAFAFTSISPVAK